MSNRSNQYETNESAVNGQRAFGQAVASRLYVGGNPLSHVIIISSIILITLALGG